MSHHNSQRQDNLRSFILTRICSVLSDKTLDADLEYCVYNRMASVIGCRGHGDAGFSPSLSARMVEFAALCDFFAMDTQ